MPQTIQAVMLDTVSIQQYIYAASNKIKEIIGASHLVQYIYCKPLQSVIDEMFPKAGETFVLDHWKDNPSALFKQRDRFDVGYIGGGNALLLFKGDDTTNAAQYAEAFIRQWTKNLLIDAPGIITAVAYYATTQNELDTNFQNVKKELDKNLAENRSQHPPQSTIPRHGITAECSRSGLSMDKWNDQVDPTEQNFVSSVTYAKLKGAKQEQDDLEQKYRKQLSGTYIFTDQIDRLGQKHGEDSHVAIVHIDGNDMSGKFNKPASLQEFRIFSRDVEAGTEKAFERLLEHIVDNYGKIMKFLGSDEDSILPIRYIMLGGDDITFVCDGKLGIYFSKLFLEFFEEEHCKRGKKLTACAGIAIVKSKYPFSRGYDMAAELCTSAKKSKKDNDDESASFLDFQISMGGILGDLGTIRSKYFQATQGKLLFRPYRVTKQDQGHKKGRNFDEILLALKPLREEWPNNKIHDLRQVLTLSESASKQFVQEMKFRDRELPKIAGGDYHETLFDKGRTPYFDLIELLEFYPDFVAVQEKGGQSV
ncbi:hypothetical protein CSB45_08670 [candidate division KSB3 bacterium]|uniref:Cas10/Cmr2 second palm domain-containing protein n=1 Tax=candidate division KSB3 bacterium TaxID=2044937 RepID=A0A2G6E4W9_9BACT|nr:MAG: hypothetical protein CSB45_08670 [candidate division KSB3 bacterium]PIE29706.1 MAG: hypothetical protein CSA57_07765 [candidate division KSB3 bacterium]